MIKIEKIRPLGSDKEIKLSDLEAEHFRRVKKYSRTLSSLTKALNNKSYIVGKKKYKLKVAQQRFIKALISPTNYKKLILGRPDVLESDFITSLDLSVYTKPGKDTLNPFGHYLLNKFAYKGFRSHPDKGEWLASQLNIKTCPYCNAQYTLSISSKSRGSRALFQFDHFFPKGIYPHLSVSLYNLVPSCANCNLIKSDEDVKLAEHYHPYHFDLSAVSEFRLIQDKKYTLPKDIDENDLGVALKSNFTEYEKLVEEHEERFDIDAIYDRHRDVVKELMVQSVIHPTAFREQLEKIKFLFDGDERLYRRFLLGNYSYEDEIPNRPLVKMTRDIAEKLKLIDD